MITFLRGTLEESLPTQIVVDVGGVGYRVFIPLSSYDRLPPTGAPIKVLTHLQVREDAHTLYGFMTVPERDLFRLLVNNVSGIGPKLALAVLSGMTVGNFKNAVVTNDIPALSKISGLGKKTAERVVLELRTSSGSRRHGRAASSAHAPTAEESAVSDAVLALISLGYKQVDAHKAIKQTYKSGGPAPPAEELVRMALKILA